MEQPKKVLSRKSYIQKDKEIKLDIIQNNGWKEGEVVKQISSVHQLIPTNMISNVVFDLIHLLELTEDEKSSLLKAKKFEFEVELVDKQSIDMIVNLNKFPISIDYLLRFLLLLAFKFFYKNKHTYKLSLSKKKIANISFFN